MTSDEEMDNVTEEAESVLENIIPPALMERYLKTYDNFVKWQSEKQVKSFSESAFVTYFSDLSKKLQPSSLWSIYSKLKTTMKYKNNVDLKKYTKITSYLKRQSAGFKSKTSKVFAAREVETFLHEAPDEIYLATKVALVLGICGACRTTELTSLTVKDIEKHDTILLVKVPSTKKNIDRTFVVKDEFAKFVKKYQNLRPQNMPTERFFINYNKGQCFKQVIGKNKLSALPKQIAKYLQLPNPELYTGHCFRRTSATLMAGSGLNITTAKRHGGCKSSAVAEGYEENTIENKSNISIEIKNAINLQPNCDLNEPRPSFSKDADYEDQSTTSDEEMDSITGAKSSLENITALRSKKLYLKTYDNYVKWQSEKQVKSFSQSALFTYFSDLSKKLQPSSLWSVYSMLKATIKYKNNVDLKKYTKITSFLKRQSAGFRSKKSKVFAARDVETFLNEAPDEIHLATKVALVLGISGACRTTELINLTVKDIEKHDKILLIKLPNTKTETDRTFVVKEEFAKFVKKYQDLRPENMQTERFFIRYYKGQCFKQVMGKNKLLTLPKQIATYLQLPNPELYTGHCFRRTSAMLVADFGVNITASKRHGWESSIVAEEHIENAVENKSHITIEITELNEPRPSSEDDDYEDQKPLKQLIDAVRREENGQQQDSQTVDLENIKEEFVMIFEEEETEKIGQKLVPADKYEQLKMENDTLICELEGYRNEAHLAKDEAERKFEKFKAHFIAQQALQGNRPNQQSSFLPPLPPPPPMPAMDVLNRNAPPTPDEMMQIAAKHETKLVSMLTAFLLSHPLGATVDYLTSYTRSMVPSVTQHMVTTVLVKHPDIFQRQSTDRWIFVLFDTVKKEAH